MRQIFLSSGGRGQSSDCLLPRRAGFDREDRRFDPHRGDGSEFEGALRRTDRREIPAGKHGDPKLRHQEGRSLEQGQGCSTTWASPPAMRQSKLLALWRVRGNGMPALFSYGCKAFLYFYRCSEDSVAGLRDL